MEADVDHLVQLLVRLWEFIQDEPLLRSSVDEILASHDATAQKKYWAIYYADKFTSDTWVNNRGNSEDVAVQLGILKLLHRERVDARRERLTKMAHESFQEPSQGSYGAKCWPRVKARVVQPIFDYLIEQLLTRQSVHGALLRYRARSEFYNRVELVEIASLKGERKTDDVEQRLKGNLNRYLHDQGIDFVIDPRLERGMIDYILEHAPSESRKTYVEAKVFDSKRRNKDYIVQGIGQSLIYARQYRSPEIYLVVYDVAEEDLVFDFPTISFIHQIAFPAVTVMAMVIDVCQHADPVSKRSAAQVRIGQGDLTVAES